MLSKAKMLENVKCTLVFKEITLITEYLTGILNYCPSYSPNSATEYQHSVTSREELPTAAG